MNRLLLLVFAIFGASAGFAGAQPSNCTITAIPNSIPREEELAGFYVAVGAASSHEPTESTGCFERALGKITNIKTFMSLCDNYMNNCTARVGRSASGTIFVSFRGSWFWQIFPEIVEGVKLVPMDGAPSNVLISSYFYNALKSIWLGTGLRAEFISLVNAHPHDRVLLTGHSLGASLATVLAAELKVLNPEVTNKVTLLGYGTPRTGNFAFSEFVANSTYAHQQFIHSVDRVPAFPSVADGFWRVPGVKLYLTEEMSSCGAFQLCAGGEDYPCSVCREEPRWNSSCYNLLLHNNYYNLKDVATFGQENCPRALD